MKKNNIYVGKVDKTKFPDIATLKIEDTIVEIKKAIDGQELEFIITKKKKNKASARILNIVQKSSLQTEQNCKFDGICGSCLYQSIKYEEQLKIKDRQIKQLLDEANEEYLDENNLQRIDNFIWEGIKKSPSINQYRNKMEYTFGDEYKSGPLSLGMHKKASNYDIITTDTCNLVHDDFNLILKESLKFFQKEKVPYYHKVKHEGFLRHLLIRRSVINKELLIALVTTTGIEKCNDPNASSNEKIEELDINLKNIIISWKNFILELEKQKKLKAKICGILHIKNNSYADAIINQGSDILYGEDYISERLLGLNFKISLFSFFQTNSLGAEILYKTVSDYIGETGDKIVFDLYSGTGTIAQLVAKYAKKVYAIEIIEEATIKARENAKLNGIDNCEFISGDVLKMIDELKTIPDIIILDPPRDGIHKKALPKILEFNADKIIYIACKPTSFARDLKIFKSHNYKIDRAVAVDMFPNTVNSELVVLLSRIK